MKDLLIRELSDYYRTKEIAKMRYQPTLYTLTCSLFIALSIILSSCNFDRPTKNVVRQSKSAIGEIREVSPGPYGDIYFDVNESIRSDFAEALEAAEFIVEYNVKIEESEADFNKRSWISKAFDPFKFAKQHGIYKISKGDIFYALSNEYNVLRYCSEKFVGVIQETNHPVIYCSFSVDKHNGILSNSGAPGIKVRFFETSPIGKGYREQYYLQSISGNKINI